MFQFKNIQAADLQKIVAMKMHDSRLNAVKNFDTAGGRQTELVMPHAAYSIGLAALKNSEDPVPEASGMRVIDATGDNFHSIYNLVQVADIGLEPQLLKDQHYVKAYENAFSKIFSLGLEDKCYEVRSLKVPALHVEALWLHKEDSDTPDLYLLIRSMKLFDDNKIYDERTFYAALKNAALTYDASDDALGG